MTQPFYVPLSLFGTTADPGSPGDGDLWYRTDLDLIRGRFNGATEELGFVPEVNQLTTDTATINSTTLVTVCSVTLNPGQYTFSAQMGVVGSGTACTPGFNLQGSGGLVTSAYRFNVSINHPNTNIGGNSNGTTMPNSTSGIATGSLGTITTEGHVLACGTFTVTTAGTLATALSRTAGSGTFVGKAGSILQVFRMG